MADKFQLKAVLTAVDKLTPTLDSVQGKIAGFRKSLAKTGLGKISFGDLVTGGALATPFVTATKSAIDFESVMADVRKVVDFPTPQGFSDMQRDILKMSQTMPMAASGIAEIVAAGGQAGIARNELTQFAKDAVQMGVAFDQTAQEAGDQMAKWRTAFRLTQDEVVSLADKINHLSNNGAANAKQISSIVTRIGPLGEVAGLASGEIAAMGATLAGVGISEEVAATGMKNFMLTLTAGKSATATQQKMFKALRMTSEEVAVGMQNDAKGMMLNVLKAISMVDKTKQASVLSSLFGRESIGAIAPLLTNIELLKKNFNEVGDASRYSGSMLKEYQARSKTTANALQQLSNQMESVKIAAGSALLPAIVEVTGALAPFNGAIFDFVEANPWLVKALAGAGLGMLTLKGAVFLLTGAMTALNAVASANPWVLGLKVAALVVGGMVANWEKICDYAETFWNWCGAIVQKLREILNTPIGNLFGGDDKSPNEKNQQPFAQQRSYPDPNVFSDPTVLTRPIGGRSDSQTTVTVDFQNAPQGMRVSKPETRGPAQVQTDVGYRTLAYGND